MVAYCSPKLTVKEAALLLVYIIYKRGLIMINDLKHQRSVRLEKSGQISIKELIPIVPKKASDILVIWNSLEIVHVS